MEVGISFVLTIKKEFNLSSSCGASSYKQFNCPIKVNPIVSNFIINQFPNNSAY